MEADHRRLPGRPQPATPGRSRPIVNTIGNLAQINFHENNPDQRARDALKDEILDAHQMPLLRLPTTGNREHQQIRQAMDNAEAHWARLSTR